MDVTNKGYTFEIKKNPKMLQTFHDANGTPVSLYGIKEEFTVSYKGDIETIKMSFGVDGIFSPCKPAYYDANLGLQPLSKLIDAVSCKSDMQKFLKSNRAIYSVNPAMICSITGKFDRSKMEWITDQTKCNFYIQRAMGSHDFGFGIKDCVYSDLLSPVKGIHTFLFEEQPKKDPNEKSFRDTITEAVLTKVRPYVESKDIFLLARL